MTASEDRLRRAELVPIGGTWHGLLFENPLVGYELQLTWTFTFDFQPVRRPYGTIEPNLTVDWVPLDTGSWRSLSGRQANASRFSEPIEASVYLFEHYRYDLASVRILDQRRTKARAGATVQGDLDGLGLEVLEADQWLRFRGVYVQPSVVPGSLQAAEDLLSGFTDRTGLIGVQRQDNYLFLPSDG